MNMDGDLMNAVLGNHLILKCIFEQISSVEDLKRVRLVSTTWRKESLDHWRRTATLHFNWKALEPRRGRKPPTNGITQQQFLNLWQRSTKLGGACPYQLAKTPFSRYRIDNCELLHVGSVECDKLERFLNIFAPNMKYLNLDQCTVLPDQYGAVLRWILCKKVESLEEFVVFLVQENIPPISAEKLLWAELDSSSSESRVSRVRKMTIEPRRLDIRPQTIPTNNTSISGTFFSGNSFPHLAHLYLRGEMVISFKGLKSLVGLKILRILSSPCSTGWNQRIASEADEEEEMYWGKLNHLHTDFFRFTPKSLEIFGRWMPNLRRIGLKFNARTRGMVAQIWPNIEEVNDLASGNANGMG